MNTILVWFRNDLRLYDHEALHRACTAATHIVPVFCFDTRQIADTKHGFIKTDAIRWQFLIESVENLAQNIQKKGGKLHITQGNPEEIIPELAQQYAAHTVYYHNEATHEELLVERKMAQNLNTLGIKTKSFWGSTLYHTDDLPFSTEKLPDVFTNFRKDCEKFATVRDTFAPPRTISVPPTLTNTPTPTLESFGFDTPDTPDPTNTASMHFVGGETQAELRLQHYFWKTDQLPTYKLTRNGLLGADYSSKFSPWLALGCISPRRIYDEIKRYEQERTANDSTYWLIFELIWRDFFRFVAKKYGKKLFLNGGLKQENNVPLRNNRNFDNWKNATTGIPFIDANMRELNETGFMSNRGRQNVASFLVHDLHCPWYAGAAYFESKLIDYDPCSNYGNWNYVAGVGNDPRENRYFNTIKQAKDYDPKADYIRHWLPELAALPNQLIFEPYLATPAQLAQHNITLGKDYPRPVVQLSKPGFTHKR